MSVSSPVPLSSFVFDRARRAWGVVMLVALAMLGVASSARAQTLSSAPSDVEAVQLSTLYTPAAAIQLQRNAVLSVQQQFRNGQRDQAMAAAERHMTQFPNDVQMRFLITVMQTQMGQQDAAIRGLTALADAYPELAEPHNNLAVIQAQRGDWDAARESLQTAVRLNPDYRTAWQNLSAVQTHLAAQAQAKAQPKAPSVVPTAAPR